MAFLFAILMSISAQAADAISFTCVPHGPVKMQGEERYVNLDFLASGKARLLVADSVSPYASIGEGLEGRASYSHTESSAYAGWFDRGTEVASISIVYMGSWWGAILHFSRDVSTPRLNFPAGTELELRCTESR